MSYVKTLTSSFSFWIYFIVLIFNNIQIDCAEYSLCWPFNFVPYKFDPGFTVYQEDYIKLQMEKINKNTCLYWSDINESNSLHNLTTFVRFKKEKYGDCITAVFYPKKNRVLRVEIRLPDHCFQNRVVLHELVHVLGFDHEHQRVDRDCYVWVSDTAKNDFRYVIEPYYAIPTIDRFPYDKQSVMHYARTNDMQALSERSYSWEPLGNDEELLTELDVWKIQYRFCGRPHYCEVHPQHCREMEQMELEMKCNIIIS